MTQPPLSFVEAEKIFHGIFDRGTQWEFAVEENEHLDLEDIDREFHWCDYGRNQKEAAKIFNKLNLGWKVVKIDYRDGTSWDYFDQSHDYEEYGLSINKVKQ